MKRVDQLTHLEAVRSFIQENELALLYISMPNCSVCTALLPKVKKMMVQYPSIQMAHVDASEAAEVAGQLSIFTAPVILLFVNGKEYIREARIVHLDLFNQKVNKIYTNFT